MPYTGAHREAVKQNIIDSARKLFNRHGFEGVSLNQIMAGAGLTQGWFYGYFKSKSDLYAEVLGCFLNSVRFLVSSLVSSKGLRGLIGGGSVIVNNFPAVWEPAEHQGEEAVWSFSV
jgi:Bacterial regulatory proteins, tetR family